MDTGSIMFVTGVCLLAIVVAANWRKASFCNIRRYKVAVTFGLLDLLVVALATAFDVQFIGLDVIPWYSYVTLIVISVFTIMAIVSWTRVRNKIVDEALMEGK